MNIISEESFKGVHNGKPTGLYTLKNKNGLIAQITNYGAIIVSIYVPDRKGIWPILFRDMIPLMSISMEMVLIWVQFADVVPTG